MPLQDQVLPEIPNPVPQSSQSLLRKPMVARLVITALLAEIGYAVLNISTMQVYLREDRHFGESLIGLVLVAFLLSEAVFKSVAGHFADRFGRRTFMMIGPGLSVATALLTLVVPRNIGALETLSFILLRVIDGMGAAMLWPAMFAAAGDAVDDDERQGVMSLLNLCYMLGIALALPIGGIVNDLTHSHMASFILASALFAGVSFSAYRSKLPTPHATPVHVEGEIDLKGFLESAKQLPQYLALAVITFTAIGFPMAIIKLFANDQFKMSESAFGGLVFPAAISLAVLSVPMAKYGERIGRTKAVHYGMALSAIGLWMIASGAIVPFLRQPWILAIGGIPVGFGFLLAIPAWMASVSDIDPTRRAMNLGAVMTAQGVGAIIGAPLGGLAYEKLQPVGVQLHLGVSFGYYSPFVGCAICMTLAWLIGLRILRDNSPAAKAEMI